MAAAVDDSASSLPKIDRQTTTPFHLKLFYRQNSFHHLSDFAIPAAPGNNGPPPPPLPPHLQIYTWQSCTLRELTQLLTSSLPSLLPEPAIGTRICFRLIYPDTRGAASTASGLLGPGGEGRGRYLSKDVGSVIVGSKDAARNRSQENGPIPRSARFQGEDADKTLQDLRFVIGDYVDCAVLPPLADGSVAPPLISRGGGSSVLGGGMRAFGAPNPMRDNNGYGRPRGGGPRGSVPTGEWKRGERIPEGPGRGRGRGSY